MRPAASAIRPKRCVGKCRPCTAAGFNRVGVRVAADIDVEISPLFALDADELAQKLKPTRPIDKPTYFS